MWHCLRKNLDVNLEFERDYIYFQLSVMHERSKKAVLGNTESQLPNSDNQFLPEGSKP